jgi:hypothetical protein
VTISPANTSEVIVALRFLCGILASACLAVTAQAGSFDHPQFTKTVDLGRSRASPTARAKVTCYFFPSFMVKEVDMGEKGAERLAIVPAANHKDKDHTCSRLRDLNEKEISSDEWTGYFKGVKGDLVFFDADDGWNGGTGFAVYNAKTGKKVFEDVAAGPLEFPDSGKLVSIKYTRIVAGDCVLPKEPAPCWAKISQKLELAGASAPDCKAGYEKSAQDLAKGRCQAQHAENDQCLSREISLARKQTSDSPSVVSYPVELVFNPDPVLKPAGGDVACRPAD